MTNIIRRKNPAINIRKSINIHSNETNIIIKNPLLNKLDYLKIDLNNENIFITRDNQEKKINHIIKLVNIIKDRLTFSKSRNIKVNSIEKAINLMLRFAHIPDISTLLNISDKGISIFQESKATGRLKSILKYINDKEQAKEADNEAAAIENIYITLKKINSETRKHKRVFISYANTHKNDKKVWDLSKSLIKKNIDSRIDQYYNVPYDMTWLGWMQHQIDLADYVIVFLSYYNNSLQMKKNRGRAKEYEKSLITTDIYMNYGKTGKFLFIIDDKHSKDMFNEQHIPKAWRLYNIFSFPNDIAKISQHILINDG